MLETNFNPFPELSTTRLLLRRITDDDAPAIFNMRSDERVMQYIERPRAKTIEDGEAFIRKIEDALLANEGITWGIELNETPGLLVGTIGYWRIMKEHYRAEIGYMLHPDQWRNGIMKEALLAVIDAGFNLLQLHSIEASINPANVASANILRSVDFVKEAYFKEAFFYEGTFRDVEIYSLLKDVAQKKSSI
jgi:[ribosomal protein S5]-alanine N-acetyltransferase